MKKLLLVGIAVIFALTFISGAEAAGFKIVGPHSVTSDNMSTTGCVGVKVYWRVKGSGAFTDANSVNAGKIWTTPYDLLQVLKVSGDYELAGTCVDTVGNESDFSKGGTGTDGSVPFVLSVLTPPTNFGTK